MTRNHFTYAIAGIGLLLASYVGAYFAIVERGPIDGLDELESKANPGVLYKVLPSYRIDGDWAESVFRPIHFLDRSLLRKAHWTPDRNK